MKKIAYDSLRLDQLKVVEDSKCCLKVNAVITKEGVYSYPDGRAFKSRMELLKAAVAIKYAGAKIVALDHPDSMVVMSQDNIQGGLEKVFFDRDKIRAVLNFDKARCTTSFLEDVRQGRLKDVSIGFYYDPDLTPGKWNGQMYDYVMRDIVIDHVAAGVLKGRCSFPSCGIGVDTMMRRIALDPFAGYKSFADCVSQNKNKGDPEAYCATIKRQVEGANALFKSKSFKKGGKKGMSLEGLFYPERSKEYNECVSKRLAEGAEAEPPITREQAEALCVPATLPKDEPIPAKTLDQEEQSAWQKCVIKHTEAGMTSEEAEAKCREEGVVKGDQDAAFENCVARKKEEGKSQEEAESECRAEHPVAEGDDEPEPTPLEKCVTSRMESTEDTAEEAKAWCEAELAGEHIEADAMLKRGKNLLRFREANAIETRRRQRS